jgi:NDP-sugar pyrophosphorylase family protein
MLKRAVILAGGLGTRLHPYTIVFPKPLMPIGNFPILEVVIRQLADNGFQHITLAVNHQADIIKSYFNSGKKWGVKIDYSIEKKALGTMGPLKLIDNLPEHFLVMNGDVLTDLNYQGFYHRHISCERIFSISSCVRSQTSEYGVLHLGKGNRLKNMEEKPVFTQEVSMGIYMLSHTVLDHIPKDRHYGFDDLMAEMLCSDIPVHVHRHNGEWLDIGRPDDYHQAIELFAKQDQKFLNGVNVENTIVRPLLRSAGARRGAGCVAPKVAHAGR